jgi:hypothetical protein
MRCSYVLRLPNTPPFDRDRESRWRSFLGEFVRPIANDFPDLLFWCSEYDGEVRFRVDSDSPEVHKSIETGIKDLKLDFDPTQEEVETLLSDLSKDRFANQSLDDSARERRAKLTLKFLCSTVRLHLDSLIRGDGQYWEYQPTPDQENPLGNNFESLCHLVGNITRFEFVLIDGNRTMWQYPKRLALWR